MKPLSVQNLDMVYEVPNGAPVHALSNVSFELEAGRMLTLLGPSGCGKTTLLNIIAGFLAPTDGSVSLGGTEITGPGSDRGMVFQQGALFEWQSVSDNISFGPQMETPPPLWMRLLSPALLLLGGPISKIPPLQRFLFNQYKAQFQPQVDELLDIVGLQGFGDKQVYELSGGMQQRVALARCLANDPEMMLMDEPLGALDALTREKMQSLILNLWSETGKSIVLVTHSVEEALILGDVVFVMAPRPGRVEKIYELPFAKRALTEDPRDIKASAEFQEVKEEILGFIWEMEEEIMGREAS